MYIYNIYMGAVQKPQKGFSKGPILTFSKFRARAAQGTRKYYCYHYYKYYF